MNELGETELPGTIRMPSYYYDSHSNPTTTTTRTATSVFEYYYVVLVFDTTTISSVVFAQEIQVNNQILLNQIRNPKSN